MGVFEEQNYKIHIVKMIYHFVYAQHIIIGNIIIE